MSYLCIKCKGRNFCGGPCKILERIRKFKPKISLEFSGSSPPEIFVGRYNYPHVFAGILAPNRIGSTENFSMPELWYEKRATIEEILNFRSMMIYSRFVSEIKDKKNKLLQKMQEISLASRAVDASFKLKKKPELKINLTSHTPIIGNPAPLENIKIESNLKIERKVDYLVNDKDAKASIAIKELYKAKIPISNINKILSAGMLGLKFQRKLVPTRWAITAVDNIISEELLTKIRFYQKISEFLLFHGDYLGNHYEILFIPSCWSFEVIEISTKGYFSINKNVDAFWHDYEFFQKRKKYAENVTGAYYANRLAIAEYLEKIKRQAGVIILREIGDEYWAPCGVGILRELTRDILKKQPEKFSNIEEALKIAETRLKLPIENWIKRSVLLKKYQEQKRLFAFIVK